MSYYDIGLKVNGKFNTEKVLKNIKFGTARGLTKTAVEGQSASQAAIQTKFRNRKTWFSKSSPIGIRITAATPQKLVAKISTAATFMPLQDTGGVKLPYGRHICVPAAKGPLANKKTIPANLRPRAVMESGKGFIAKAKDGTELMFLRTGKGGKYSGKDRFKGVQLLYVMVLRAQIKRADVFDRPIQETVRRRLPENLQESINDALANIK